MKKPLPSLKFPIPLPSPPTIPPSHWDGRFLPYHFNAIWKTLACFTFSSRGVGIISTYFSVWLWIVTQFNTPKDEISLKVLLVIKNGFLISTWKYWIWILKNESILRIQLEKGVDYFSIQNYVWAVTFFQLEKYRLVYWINVREQPKYTLIFQQLWKLTNNGPEWCKFKMHVTGCFSIIKY